MSHKVLSSPPPGYNPQNPNQVIPGYGVSDQGKWLQFNDPNSMWAKVLSPTQNGQYAHTPVMPNIGGNPNTVPGIGAMPGQGQNFQSPIPQILPAQAPQMTPANPQVPQSPQLSRPTLTSAQKNMAGLNQFQNPFLRF